MKHSEWMRTSGGGDSFGFADDDGEVVEPGALAAEGDHAGIGRIFQRHLGGGHLAQAGGGDVRILQHIGGGQHHEVLALEIRFLARAQRGDQHRRQQQRQLAQRQGGAGHGRQWNWITQAIGRRSASGRDRQTRARSRARASWRALRTRTAAAPCSTGRRSTAAARVGASNRMGGSIASASSSATLPAAAVSAASTAIMVSPARSTTGMPRRRSDAARCTRRSRAHGLGRDPIGRLGGGLGCVLGLQAVHDVQTTRITGS